MLNRFLLKILPLLFVTTLPRFRVHLIHRLTSDLDDQVALVSLVLFQVFSHLSREQIEVGHWLAKSGLIRIEAETIGYLDDAVVLLPSREYVIDW